MKTKRPLNASFPNSLKHITVKHFVSITVQFLLHVFDDVAHPAGAITFCSPFSQAQPRHAGTTTAFRSDVVQQKYPLDKQLLFTSCHRHNLCPQMSAPFCSIPGATTKHPAAIQQQLVAEGCRVAKYTIMTVY